MNNLPIDTHDMLKYGHLRKEDVIHHYKNDSMFEHFQIMDLGDDDHFDIPYDSFNGMWQYSIHFGLGVSTKISLFDGTGPLLLRFDTDIETEYSEILLKTLPDNYRDFDPMFDLGIKIVDKEYVITYRNQVKEILQDEWPKYCKELLHHFIMISASHYANIDRIREHMRYGLPEEIPLESHHQIRKWIQDFDKNIIAYYPYMLGLQKCPE